MNYSKKQIEKLADELIEWMNEKDEKGNEKNWWINNFAIEKKIPVKEFRDLEKKNKKFKSALEYATEIQEAKIVEKGIGKQSNATFIMFILKNIHGWKTNPESVQEEEKIPEINLVSS